MESQTVINVSTRSKRFPNGVHFFRVILKGADMSNAETVYNDLVSRYPAEEFHITMTAWNVSGRNVCDNN